MSNITSFAERAVVKISARLASDMEDHANALEAQGIEISGPDALRTFASFIRKTNAKMIAANN
jgi:hypothetical protein